MNNMITVALSKGRLSEYALSLLSKCGINCEKIEKDDRRLVFYDENKKFSFLFVKPSDVPTYVESGVCDIGVVGKDTLMEEDKDIYEMLDLGFGKCRICIAGYEERREVITNPNLKVATKYVNIAKQYFNNKGENIEIIKLNGSVELGPVIGLSDVILDIVESGSTLKANGLVILETICDVSARLVVNKVSLKTKQKTIVPLIEKIDSVLKGE